MGLTLPFYSSSRASRIHVWTSLVDGTLLFFLYETTTIRGIGTLGSKQNTTQVYTHSEGTALGASLGASAPRSTCRRLLETGPSFQGARRGSLGVRE